MPVRAAEEFRHIGKETDRRWEREDHISLLNPRLVEYRPPETGKLTTDPTLQQRARQHSIRSLSKAAGVTEKTVKALRRGERIRKSTGRKIEQGLILLDARDRQIKRRERKPRLAVGKHYATSRDSSTGNASYCYFPRAYPNSVKYSNAATDRLAGFGSLRPRQLTTLSRNR